MKKVAFIISLSLVLGLNIYFRAFPIYFPQLKTQAKNITEDKIYKDIVKGIDRDFSEFSIQAKNKLFKAKFLEYKRKNKQQIKNQIEQEYKNLKAKYQDEKGQTYLMELDCWHWARYVDNVLQFGRVGDEIINGKEMDTLMLAPSGSQFGWHKFLFYLSAFLYKIFSFIKPIPLFTFLFYLPLFFIAIFIILLYIFCFLHWGNLCAIISCLYVGLAPIFMPRSCAGWFDTDILNLLFPLLIVWTYLSAYKNISFRLRTLWIFFSSFWVGLFCFTWQNWWFIFLIIISYEAYSLLNLILIYVQYKQKNPILFKKHLSSLFLFLLFSFLWVVIFSGSIPIATLFNQLKDAIILNKPLIGSVWPNVLSTVEELGKPDYFDIISHTGGTLLFIFGLICMLALFLRHLRRQKSSDFESEFILILIFWLLSMLFACSRGIRFTMFILMPLGISLGWMINEAYEYFRIKKKKIIFVVLAIFIVLCATFTNNAYVRAKGIYPLMNDTWYKILITLKEKTPPKAIINSWWDFGDWFKVISRRRVIFDGQSANMPQAYWMANVLLSDNEEEAIKILRMLNNGGNSAFEIINSHLKDPFKSVLLLKRIISSDSKQAKESLLKFLPAPITEKVIKLIFDKPQYPAYFVVDYTMQGKISSISFLGNWDFAKVYLAYSINKKEKTKTVDYLKEWITDKEKLEKLYQEGGLISKEEFNSWVSSRSRFYSGIVNGQKKNEIVLFDNGLVYHPKEQSIFLYSQNGKYKIPKSLFLFENNNLKEIAYPNKELDFSILILKDQENYQAILLDPQLAESLLVRLYFLKGAGLKHFKPFIEEKEDNNKICVFEIIWE